MTARKPFALSVAAGERKLPAALFTSTSSPPLAEAASLHRLLERGVVADVARMDRRDAAGIGDGGRRRLELLRGAPDERHLRSVLREQARDAGADAAAASGDERRLSGEEVRCEDAGIHELFS